MKKKAYFKISYVAQVIISIKYPNHPLAIKGFHEPVLSGKSALEFLKKYSK